MKDDYDPRVDPWQIDEAEFYEIEDQRAQLEFLLRYATLAPSSHNSQPWSFRHVPEGVAVFADYSRRLPIGDPADRELLMSIGAAITNFRVAAAHFGLETTTLYDRSEGESEPLAVIAIRETCNPQDELRRLFPAIPRRRTNRHVYEQRGIDPAALSTLCDFMEEHSDVVQFVVPHDQVRAAELVAEGDQTLMSSAEYRRELASWMRPNESSASDGMCGDAFGIRGPVAALSGWMLRSFDLGPTQAAHDRELVEKAAGLVVITADDDRVALIRAGETLELLLLLLTTLDVQYSFMNQAVELETLRRELWAMVRSERPPQLMLRIGYARNTTRAMPRRSVSDIVQR